jgi:hypothetical protein
VAKSKKRSSKSMRAAIPENPPKTMVYDALATWNRDFDQVLEDLQRLEALRLFPRRWRREFLKGWQAALGEIRAWANFEVIEVLHQTEEEEWTNFARRRRRLEKRSASSGDVSVPTKSSAHRRRKTPPGANPAACETGHQRLRFSGSRPARRPRAWSR